MHNIFICINIALHQQRSYKMKPTKQKRVYKVVSVDPITFSLLEKILTEVNSKRGETLDLEMNIMEGFHHSVKRWADELGIN